MAHPRFQRARAFKFIRRTAGDVVASGTTWHDISTALDIVLDAQVGDVVEYGIFGAWGQQTATGYIDVATVVSGAVVNVLTLGGPETTDTRLNGWFLSSGESSYSSAISGSVMYALQASDISNGTVTLRLRGRVSAGTSRTINANATTPLQVWAKNLGPVDPT